MPPSLRLRRAQILFFFFFSIILLKFDLPVFVICLISILNDGTIMSIAYDAVTPSLTPTRWELPRTCGVAATIGAVGVASTFLLLFLARPIEAVGATGGLLPSAFHTLGLPQLADAQVQALIYLQLSIGGQATIFVARTSGLFFTQAPGVPLLFAFIFAQIVSTVLTVYVTSGLSPMIGLGMDCELSGGDWALGEHHIALVNECSLLAPSNASLVCADLCEAHPALGWKYAGLVWAYCAIWLFVQDAAKLIAFRVFDMADPARAEARRQRIGNKQLLARASQNSTAGGRHTGAHGGNPQRSTHRSTGISEGVAYPVGAAGPSDAMLEPHAATSRVDARALPELVAQLEARVRDLEAQLVTRGSASTDKSL